MHTNNERQLLARIAELETQQKILAEALRYALDCANRDDTSDMQPVRDALAQLNAP